MLHEADGAGIRAGVEALRSGAVAPAALLKKALARIRELDPRINAFAWLDPRLSDADQARASDSEPGPLEGIPVAVKDLIDVEGMPSAAGSPGFFGAEPAERDAFAVARLRGAGALILGKTNTHEIALGITGINPHTGPVRNPHDLTRITGGSSSGSAAAVASGMAMAALGTDTGGSIRIPAALCGVVGFKPTRGRVSLRGVLPLSWNLDHLGPLARSVDDAAIVYRVMAGYDPEDPSSRRPPGGTAAPTSGRPLRLAVASGAFIEEADPEVLSALRSAEEALGELENAAVERVDADFLREAAAANGLMVVADAAAFHRERLALRPERFGPDVRERLERGRSAGAVDYALARRTQSEMIRKMELFFAGRDYLILPTTAAAAAPIEGLDSAAYAPKLTRYTAPFNLAGLPALSLPWGSSGGLPLAVQIVGRAWDDEGVLALAAALEGIRDGRA